MMNKKIPAVLAAAFAILAIPMGAGALGTQDPPGVSASLNINVNIPVKKPTLTVVQPTINVVDRSWEARADKVVAIAKGLIGVAKYSHRYNPPYTMDGSGFTYYVYKRAGIDLGTRDDDKQVYKGVKVGRYDLRKGDLVFFSSKKSGRGNIGQAGIYIGGDRFIQIFEPGKTAVISRLNESEWWSEHYVTARRVIL